MKNSFLHLALFLSLFGFTQCESQLPDLTFQDWEYVQNPCTGATEHLDVRNFYQFTAPNGFSIWLYYRPQENAFFDCYGMPWNLWPPFYIRSPRYAINKGEIGKKTETVRAPTVRAYTKVIDPAGNTVDENVSGDIVINDLPPDQSTPFETTIVVNYDNSAYFNSYEIDPSIQVDERDESNNMQGGSFERSSTNGGNHFLIHAAATEKEFNLRNIRYMRFKDGKIEVRN